MSVAIPQPRLSGKLLWMVIGFLGVALTAIGFTLYESWKLEGGAAVINDMGSERMRSYRIAYLVAEGRRDPASDAGAELQAEIVRFESVLAGLRAGDPVRPLVLPRNRGIVAALDALEQEWAVRVKPLVLSAAAGDAATTDQLRPRIEGFVQRIDALVRMIEENNARDIAILRYMQFGLIALAVVGAMALIYLMFVLVVRPVGALAEGMQRMSAGDFGARLAVETHDEFGDLADGFNRMASRLQDLYATLEQRVAGKTRDLAARNRELAALYEVARLLGEPAAADELCRSFLRRLMDMLQASGGSVRLIDDGTRQLHLFAHEGLTGEFAAEERCIDIGECLCGEAARLRRGAVDVLDDLPAEVAADCRRAGYRTVAIFPILGKGRLLGVFNLYFPEPRRFSQDDRSLLEALGRHLAVAIENRHLASRERELAVFEERSLLARELHDSIAQALAFLNIQVQMLEDSLSRGARGEVAEVLARIREGVQESYDDVRELLTHFRARVSSGEDIGEALRRMLGRFGEQTGITTAFSESGTGVPLQAETRQQVLHILQEALSNVRKHSAARRVTIDLRCDGAYRFTVADDGRGFDATAAADDGHIGLRIMRERAQRIGATVEVVSAPGRGTVVTLLLAAGQSLHAAPAAERAA
jgi:two-component system nitrate/nitrite sensor histidine kinase NarX